MEDTKETKSKKFDKLIPRCLYGDRSAAFVNSGHISPCCWVDGDFNQKIEGYKELFTEKMKLENFKTVDEIFLSDEWLNFFKMLKNKPESAPYICWKHCGDFIHDKNQTKTPMRDIYSSEQYKALKEKYQLENARARCVDGISAVLTKK